MVLISAGSNYGRPVNNLRPGCIVGRLFNHTLTGPIVGINRRFLKLSIMEIKLNKNNARVFQDSRTGSVTLIIDKPRPMIIEIPIALLSEVKTKSGR